MKKTYALAFLFFAGLAILWGLEYAQVPREEERLARMNRILRSLFDIRVREIRRVEIQRGDQLTSFERRDNGRWQMVKPFDAAADPAVVENLIQNLIDLSKSPDVGTLTDSSQAYGLEPPASVIRVFGVRSAQTGQGSEVQAALEIGNSQREVRFVRAQGERGIEAVDAKLLNTLELPLADWREKSLVPVPTFQVAELSIHAADASYEAARSRTGQWTLRKPVVVPANGIKIENLLAGLSAVRVTDGADGFVANDVRDTSKFGLNPPELTVTLKTIGLQDKPIVLQLGKPAPNKPDRIYAKRGDQDDVVLVNSKVLSDIPRNPKDLRVGKVTDFEPARVVKIGIEAPAFGGNFILNRTSTGWQQAEPNTDRVEGSSIQALIEALNGLQSSELLDAKESDDPRMSPLNMTIRLWQQAGKAAPGSEEPSIESQPTVSLLIGKHDTLRKTIYGRIEGDSFILALPDTLVKVLPKNSFAFRDRVVLTLNPGQIKSLSIKRDGQTHVVAPSASPGSANQWRLTAPIEAKVDMPTLSQIFASLSQLRAEDFVADAKTKKSEIEHQVGLARPVMEIVWETEAKANDSSSKPSTVSGRLKVGGRVGRTSAFYAKLDQLPIIFTLDAATLANFEGELRDHTILSFAADQARKIVLKWPNRTTAFLRKPGTTGTSAIWAPDPTTDPTSIDVSRISPMLTQMARLQTIKFLQYSGILPVMTGLTPPRLTIEVQLDGEPTPRVLRIGKIREGGIVYGAEGTSDSGPVFFLPAAAWNNLVEAGTPIVPLPDDVFAPVVRP